jgi:predicted nucleotide-binding protein
VRLKIGEDEAEAPSVAELEELWKIGTKYRDKTVESGEESMDGSCAALFSTPDGQIRVVGDNHEEVSKVFRDIAGTLHGGTSRFVVPTKVFVVHGHDETALQATARFVEQLKLEAIVLREQPDRGLTIIEKFEHSAAEVGFAIVLLTPDDLSGPAGGSASGTRARQNVIFELGYFAGKLGRGRTCLLRKGSVDIPSDLQTYMA